VAENYQTGFWYKEEEMEPASYALIFSIGVLVYLAIGIGIVIFLVAGSVDYSKDEGKWRGFVSDCQDLGCLVPFWPLLLIFVFKEWAGRVLRF